MNRNSEAIIMFCSHLCVEEGIHPLEPAEWSVLAEKLRAAGLTPADLLSFRENGAQEKLNLDADTAARYRRLLDRGGSLEFAISNYENMGIHVLTRADQTYPKALKAKLGNACPPLFYFAGELSLLDRPAAGYAGSRNVSIQDAEFTRKTVEKTVAHGYGVVTGGAKGIDQISREAALGQDAPVIEYASDSLDKKLRQSAYVRAIQNGKLLVLSVARPDAGFHVGIAMMRNRYIYAQSGGTVVVRAEKGKGGTWAGASENLKRNWCPTLCWDHDYSGNQALIELGAIPIDDSWEGDLSALPQAENRTVSQPEQLSLFD